jgi:ABC-2 type transport system ATP-binding protein
MIQVEHLTKAFGPRLAISDVTFDVQKGEILGFLGPNGAGKTTTMRILTGFMPATSGSASVAGFDVFEQSLDARRHIGYLPENVPLYPEMTVWSYLNFMAELRGVKDRGDHVEDVMEAVQITERADQLIGKLSKGFRQRVGLAQALVHDPDVLILDEPTRGIDVGARAAIYDVIADLARSGMAVVVVSSDLEEVLGLSHRVLVLSRGRQRGILDRSEASNVAVMELATS